MGVQKHGRVWVLKGATVEVGPHGTGNSGMVEECWEREEGVLLECLVWMKHLGGPWEDRGRCYGHQQGLLGV